MTLTLKNFNQDDEATLRGIFNMLNAMGDRLNGWNLGTVKVNRKSAQLSIKWTNDVDPMTNRDLPFLFEQAPAQLFAILARLLDDMNPEGDPAT